MDCKPKDSMMPYLQKNNSTFMEKMQRRYSDHRTQIQGTAIAAGALAALLTFGNIIYDKTARDEPEEFKNFPANTLQITDVDIPSRHHEGRVEEDIVLVEMTEDPTQYKMTKNPDGTITYEGPFHYEIRPNTAFLSTGYGSATREGKVTVRTKETIDHKVN